MRGIAYTDDLLVLITGNSRFQIETTGQDATNVIEEWCAEEKLTLSAQKTEMILLRSAERNAWPSWLRERAIYDIQGNSRRDPAS